LIRGSNNLVIDETERSLHDALCVVRCLVKNRGIIPGGGAIEVELAQKLAQYARTLKGAEQNCVKAFADALEIVPFTLSENAGLDPVTVVTELRNRHALGHKFAGINVKGGRVVNDILCKKYNIM
jgi:T-complex protein 1 subunit delta